MDDLIGGLFDLLEAFFTSPLFWWAVTFVVGIILGAVIW
jgi:hypothetical protein